MESFKLPEVLVNYDKCRLFIDVKETIQTLTLGALVFSWYKGGGGGKGGGLFRGRGKRG